MTTTDTVLKDDSSKGGFHIKSDVAMLNRVEKKTKKQRVFNIF